MEQKTIIIIAVVVCLLSISIGVGIYFATKSEDTSSAAASGSSTGSSAAGSSIDSSSTSSSASASVPEKVWKRSNDTIAVGGASGGVNSMLCKDNTFVTEFSGASGSLIDRIGVKCSDGTSLGPFGGNGGGPFTVQSADGFTKLVTKTGTLVDSIKFYNNDTELKKVGGDGGPKQTDLACNGGKIMGLNVRTGDLVDNIQVICATKQ